MNGVKALAEQVGVCIEGLERVDGVDKRWLAVAKTDLQKGFMAAVRAVAKPETF